MQYKVPQDVLRPDKIVGFLTLRQLVICSMGGGVAYSLYLILSKQYLVEIWLPPVLFVSVFTAAFAFFRFHDLAFEKVVLLFIEYQFKPRARKWQKMNGDYVHSVLSSPIIKSQKKSKKTETITESERRKKLLEATKAVDTHKYD